MTTYIGLLRGINVGGKNIIKMADLKTILTRSGLSNVRTYIQSGNIIFESELIENEVKNKIESEIEKSYGFFVPVILRTKEELEQIISQNPFTGEEIKKAKGNSEFEVFYISLSEQVISEKDILKLENTCTEKELFYVNGRNVYFLFDGTVRNSKMALVLQNSENSSTTRNWKTIRKLETIS